MNFETLITARRRKPTSISGRELAEELASDRSRILYSAPFRRLAKKAQVFSLESNAAVRNRITHSLEVSDVGRWIAYEITKELVSKGKLNISFQLPIIYAVENACFLHDIGNPPFGHFGESAIRKWFEEHWETCYRASCETDGSDMATMSELIKDFTQFDGNPQGVRIILRLRRDRDEYGLNLTYTTILSLIKYVRSPCEPEGSGLRKKPGYFESEKEIVLRLKRELGMEPDGRYPLAYVMEVADDIAYCISDIEDGIEKGIITNEEFFAELADEWKKIRSEDDPADFPIGDIGEEDRTKFFDFKTSYTRESIKKSRDRFLEDIESLLSGSSPSLFPANSPESKAFECLKRVARRKLFRSREAENPELAGYQIVTGLLDKLSDLLSCRLDQFERLLAGRDDSSLVTGQKLDYQWRLFNKLPRKHLDAYRDLRAEFSQKKVPEWYFRAHLIVDYISGMTDGYALELYQLLNGIRLEQQW